MKLGIVGLPNAGKTTVFNALTHAGALATAYAFSSAEANHGVVAVPDERLDRLNEVLQTPREVHATIEVVDIPGLGGGAEHPQGLGSRFLADIREVDAVAHVVRAFENPEVAFPRAAIDPVADVEAVETELVLSDLELVERRRDKTVKAARAGDARPRRRWPCSSASPPAWAKAAVPARSNVAPTKRGSCATSPSSPSGRCCSC